MKLLNQLDQQEQNFQEELKLYLTLQMPWHFWRECSQMDSIQIPLMSWILRTLKYVSNNDNSGKYPELYKRSSSIEVYSDASYASNYYSTPQLQYIQYIVILADENILAHPVFWPSHKSNWAARLVLVSVVMAFANSFLVVFLVRHDIKKMIKRNVQSMMMTDSPSLFDVLTNSAGTTRKRLMILLKRGKDSYDSHKINSVSNIRSKYNPAYALTKVKRNTAL